MKVTKEDIEAYNRVVERAKELVLGYAGDELLDVVNLSIENSLVFIDYASYDSILEETYDDTLTVTIDYFIGENERC